MKYGCMKGQNDLHSFKNEASSAGNDKQNGTLMTFFYLGTEPQ